LSQILMLKAVQEGLAIIRSYHDHWWRI